MIENKTKENAATDDFVRLGDLWGLFLPRWRWFLLSLFVALALAVLYLLATPVIYTRSASILIKDDSKGNTTNAMNEFVDLGIFKSKTNINNELLTLKSPTLMSEVVCRLGLDETYSIRRGLKTIELYKASPLVIHWLDKAMLPVSFSMEIQTDSTFLLSDLVWADGDTDETWQIHPGESVRTPAGTIVVNPSLHFSPESIGTIVYYTKGTLSGVTDVYTKKMRAELGNEDATIINLSIDDASVRKAEDILNTLIEVYNEHWIQDKNQIAVSTSQFISERLGVIEGELGNVDENISSYKSEHLLPDVQMASNLYLTQSEANKRELLALSNQISTAKYIRAELDGKDLSQTLPTNSGISNSNIEGLIVEYNDMVLNRNRLKANSSEKNPLVQDMETSLKSMRETIIQSVDNLIVSLNTQIGSIRQQQMATTKQLSSGPNQAKYLLSVERQQKVKEALYLYLLQKREENELSQAFTAYNTRVITAPRGSMLPTFPRKINILLVAVILGLLVPALIIFMKENMNTKVRGRKDLEKLTIPFVGEIPLYSEKKRKGKKGRQKKDPVVVSGGNRNIINEAFRVLRSNIDFVMGKDKNNNVILFTSFNPGSGKSFISMNIAICFALKRKKVLVIDGDMRHGTLSSHVHSPQKGLSDYLSAQTDDWKDIVVMDETHESLHVIPIGTVPPNPTELLEEGRLMDLLKQARGEYDYIFIDCPPIELVADTQIIEKMADRTIFVIRSGLMERSMLGDLETIYQEKRYKNLAMVLNGTESIGGRYGYRYGYKYGYHHGYASYYGGK